MSSGYPERNSQEAPRRPGGLGDYDIYAHGSSTQSLMPDPEQNGRRKLLIVYIHGFMGNDNSFQSFPVHVHRYLRLSLSDTHVIHSKIYPRYKTYKAIEVARDNFSKWLQPHESPDTDVVLVGHSMGGLLSAEVVLMPTLDQHDVRFFQHRILGTVNLDAPLLGLHPGIVASGLSSLFRPKPDPPSSWESLQGESTSQIGGSETTSAGASILTDISDTPVSPSASSSTSQFRTQMTFDPYYNPTFVNDVRLKDRGWWKNVVHFVKKHNSEGLIDAATNHIMSHLEFGSCLMDFESLKLRYQNLRRLEDVDDIKHHGFPHVPPQVRFVQYYTVCNGYPKKPKADISGTTDQSKDLTDSIRPEEGAVCRDTEHEDSSDLTKHQSPPMVQNASSSVLEVEAPIADASEDRMEEGEHHSDVDDIVSVATLTILDPEPLPEDEDIASLPPGESTLNENITIPTISDTNHREELISPEATLENPHSESLDLSRSQTPNLDGNLTPIPSVPRRPTMPDLSNVTDKTMRKQLEKEAKEAQKAYQKAVDARDKVIKERQKAVEKKLRQQEKEIRKKNKEHKFCNLPDKVNGERDSKWVKVFVKDVDEVAAHSGIFLPGPHYEKLVGDVGDIIIGWVQEDATKQLVLGMADLD
ncbi:hypothetical protein BX600DRAFT_463305 [Xylariales sp. PMI_506]|nr:hypothetical protein BX600DRAFT_463305 [Xylariales sp. PMI_506]